MNEILNLVAIGLLTWAGRTLYQITLDVAVLSTVIQKLEKRVASMERSADVFSIRH